MIPALQKLKMYKLFIILLCCFGFNLGSKHKDKIYSFISEDENVLQFLNDLERNNSNVDFVSPINKVGKPILMMVPPENQNSIEKFLRDKDIVHEVCNTYFEETLKASLRHGFLRDEVTFERFLKYYEINAYLDKIANDYPDIVTASSIGKSYEGRDIKIVRISSGQSTKKPKPVIFVDAGFHAVEWTGPSVAVYLIQQLVEDKTNRNLIKDVDWVILPLLNPDGYEYAMMKRRPWRKTRSKGEKCPGADANRNFEYKWNEGSGVASDECSHVYAGKKPFSEIETRNLKNYLLNLKNVKAYITLHTCGKYLLYPWSYTTNPPDNEKELKQVGNMMNDAIGSVRNTFYKVGSAGSTLWYTAGGSSLDWAKSIGIDIAFTIELPCGEHGCHLIPTEEIAPVVIETFEGFKALHKYINVKYK